MHAGIGSDDVEQLIGGSDSANLSIRSDDVKPLGKEKVYLVRVFLKGGEAGGIPVDVESGADTLFRVEGDGGGGTLGSTVPSGARTRLFFLFADDGVVGAARFGQLESGENAATREGVHEDSDDDSDADAEDVQSASCALPALATGVVEDGLIGGGHSCFYRKCEVTLHSLRACVDAAVWAMVRAVCGDGSGAAAAVRVEVSAGRRGFADLWRHCKELAAAWRLRS